MDSASSSSSSSLDSAKDETEDDALPSVVRSTRSGRFGVDSDALKRVTVAYCTSLIPPPFKWFKFVTWQTLRGDFIAGLTVAAFMIPQAVAYAQLAGLKPAAGFYSSGIPAIVYAWFGTSHVASVGPVALSSLLSGSAVSALKLDNDVDFAAASIALAMLIGILQVCAGLLRLGIVVRFLSNPVLSGFTTAAGISIAATQLKHLFGVKVGDQPTVFHTVYYVASELPNSNVPAVIISAVCLAFLLTVRWAKRRFKASRALKFFPEQLFVMVVGTIVSYAADLSGTYGTRVVGALPQAFPLPTVPDGKWMGALFVDAIMLSLIGFTESISVSTLFADKAIYKAVVPHDASQELIALGAAKVFGSFFSCFAVTGGLSRSAVAAAAGAVTPITSVIAGVIAILAGFLSSFLEPLPQAVLASNIMIACVALLKFEDLQRLSVTKSRVDLFLWLVTVAATLGVGVSLGLLISVGLSLLLVVLQTSRAHHARLGLVPGTTDMFRNVLRFRNVVEIPHVAIVRYDAPLFFANAQHFCDVVRDELRQTSEPRAVICDFSAVSTVDFTALELMRTLTADLARENIRIVFADVKGPVRDRIDAAKWVPTTDRSLFANTIRSAVRHLRESGVLRDE